MKSKMSKKLIAFILCMVLVICNSVSILADTPAPEATTTAQQTKTAGENSDTKKRTTDGTENVSAQSEDSADTKKPSDEDPAPEVKTTEKKKETTEVSTEKKEDSAAADEKKDDPAEVTTKAKEETEKADEPTTETTTGEQDETKGAEESSTKGKEGTGGDSDKKDTEKVTEEKNETAPTTQSQTYNGKYEDETVIISVSAEAGIVPEGAELSVTPIVKTEITDDMSEESRVEAEQINAQYDLTEKKLTEDSEANEETMEGFLAYDISFLVNGEEVEPSGDVKVVMDFKEAAVPEGVSETADVSVKHLKEDVSATDGVVVEDMGEKADVQTTDKAEVEKVEFTAESFSTYSISWEKDRYSLTIHIVDKNGDPIGNESYTIGNPERDNLCSRTGLNLETYGTSIWCPEGYYLIVARLDNVDGTDAGKVYYYDDQWKYSDETTKPNDYRIWTGTSDCRHVYLIYGAETTDALTTVNTVEKLNEQYGISISMKDLDFTKKHASYDAALGGQYSGPVQQGLVQSKLSNDYPQTQSGKSLEELFNGGTDVNNFFIKDTLEDEGYFEYSSFNNYAYLNGKRFKIYNQKGAVSKYENAGETEFYFHRGNFLPYNDLTGTKSLYLTNLYDEDGNKIARTDSRFGQQLYLSNGVNYHFSMQMTATFLQPRNGITDRGDQMVFEFNGDDDMWVFINKVLILDIGGEHDAHSGTINFATGVVTVNISASQTVTTSLNKLYEEANVFPDGTTWNDEKISDYFVSTGARDSEGDLIYRFKDYDRYTMKMFYLERGAGASNLHVRFNLQTVPDGTVTVAKELDNTDKEKYANEDFQFELYVEKKAENWSEEHPIYTGEYEQVTQDNMQGLSAELRQNGVSTGDSLRWSDDGTKFLLKSDQSIVFSGLKANQRYYVKEVGVESERYNDIIINSTTVINRDDDGNIIDSDTVDIVGNTIDVSSGESTVYARPIVTFTNNCSESNHRELRITKSMETGQLADADATFTFQIQLESTSGEMVNYVGPYYLKRDGAYYYYNEEGDLVSNGNISKVCGNTTNGQVSGIKVGDTISITSLLSGTNFKVWEIDPNKDLETDIYSNPTYEVEGGTAENINDDGEYASGTILLGTGKDAEVTVTNSLTNVPDSTFIEVQKTFVGLTQEQINSLLNFQITVKDVASIVIATLNLQGGTSTIEGVSVSTPVSATSEDGITYTWKITGVEDGSYSVEESGQSLDKYSVTTTVNGEDLSSAKTVETKVPTYTVSEVDGKISAQSDTEFKFSEINAIVISFTGDDPAYLVWTEEMLSSGERKAIVDGIAKIGNGQFGSSIFSTEKEIVYFSTRKIIEKGFDYRGHISVNENGTLKFEGGKNQWNMIWAGTYKKNPGVNAEIEIVNSYEEIPVTIDLQKYGSDNYTTQRAGATFSLFRGEPDIENSTIKWSSVTMGEKYTNIPVTENNLKELTLTSGYYMLKETKAPTGFELLDEAIYFQIDGGTVKLITQNGIEISDNETEMWKLDTDNNAFVLKIKNDILYNLPSAGGPGIYWYTLSGTFLMAGAALIVYRQKRKREVLLRK